MENKSEIKLLFPTPILITSLPTKYSSICPILDSFELKEPSEMNLNFGRRSKNSYILNELPFKELSTYILKEAVEYGKQALNYSYNEYKFTQSWTSYKYPGEEHIEHSHPNSLISGVFYYGEFNTQSPSIAFHRPPFNNTLRPKRNPQPQNPEISSNTFVLSPIPGTLLLFPSEVTHSVPENKTNIIRKSVAFNIVPIEGLGNEENLTELKFN